VNNILKFLKSIKLAVGLISYITITSILATLVPQGDDAGFYLANYPEILSGIILFTGFDNYFKSLLFLIPSLLFFLNLLVCSVDRLAREIGGRAKKRFGPDILHLGLLALIIGAILSFMGREEGRIYMAEGDKVKIEKRYAITLKSFKSLTYPDGRPRDWISTVDIEDGDGSLLVKDFPIEVNSPLAVAGISIYQVSFSQERRVLFKGPDGKSFYLGVDEELEAGSDSYRIADIRVAEGRPEDSSVVLEKWVQRKIEDTIILGKSGRLAGYEILGISFRELTGLQFVRDPGALAVIISLIICGIGLCLTFIQKIGDEKL
jgi:cytochrome c biogenesis protein ResB